MWWKRKNENNTLKMSSSELKLVTATTCSQRSTTCALKPHLSVYNRVTRRASVSRRNTFQEKKKKPTQNKMKFNTKFRPFCRFGRSDAIPCAYVPVTSRFSRAAVEVEGGCGCGAAAREWRRWRLSRKPVAGRAGWWINEPAWRQHHRSSRSSLFRWLFKLTGRLAFPHLFIAI